MKRTEILHRRRRIGSRVVRIAMLVVMIPAFAGLNLARATPLVKTFHGPWFAAGSLRFGDPIDPGIFTFVASPLATEVDESGATTSGPWFDGVVERPNGWESQFVSVHLSASAFKVTDDGMEMNLPLDGFGVAALRVTKTSAWPPVIRHCFGAGVGLIRWVAHLVERSAYRTVTSGSVASIPVIQTAFENNVTLAAESVGVIHLDPTLGAGCGVA